jgi:hypothetical protein
VGNSFIRTIFVTVRGLWKVKETVATLGFLLFFLGSMMDIAGSTFVTEGGTPAAVYFKVGVIELTGTIIFFIGMYLIVKTR